MSWIGTRRNQYGSILEITEEAGHRVSGKFCTALDDSGFFGQEIEVVGVCHGDCIGLAAGGKSAAGDMVVTYAGLLRDGKLETLWYVVADAGIGRERGGRAGAGQKAQLVAIGHHERRYVRTGGIRPTANNRRGTVDRRERIPWRGLANFRNRTIFMGKRRR